MKKEEIKYHNRIKVILPGIADIEVESYDRSLEDVFHFADLIARHAGKAQGIDGETFDERLKRHGIE